MQGLRCKTYAQTPSRFSDFSSRAIRPPPPSSVPASRSGLFIISLLCHFLYRVSSSDARGIDSTREPETRVGEVSGHFCFVLFRFVLFYPFSFFSLQACSFFICVRGCDERDDSKSVSLINWLQHGWGSPEREKASRKSFD